MKVCAIFVEFVPYLLLNMKKSVLQKIWSTLFFI